MQHSYGASLNSHITGLSGACLHFTAGADEFADPRLGCRKDFPAATKPGHHLAIADCGAAEVARPHSGLAEEGFDFVDQDLGALFGHGLHKISSKEDMSIIPDEGRAKMSEIEDIPRMGIADWRERLQSAVDESGRSARAVSLAAGKGPGYVHSILKEGKEPTVDSLIAICAALDVSLAKIIYGIEMSPETAEILSLLENSPASRDGILQILRDRARP